MTSNHTQRSACECVSAGSRSRAAFHDDVTSSDGQSEAVEFLVERGAAVNMQNHQEMAPLHFAAMQPFPSSLQVLLSGESESEGACVRRHKNFDAFVFANWFPHEVHSSESVALASRTRGFFLESARRSLCPPAALKNTANQKRSSTHLYRVKVKNLSSPGGASVELKDESGQTATHKACGFGTLRSVRHLVQSGASVNDLDFKGQRPLHLACEEGKLDTVQFLLQKGAKCSVQDKDGVSPLHLAAKNGAFSFLLSIRKGVRRDSFEG